MHPDVIHLGRFTLHSYGLMLAISFFVGILLASRRAPARGLSPDLIFDTALVIIFAAILGARLLYVAFHMNEMRGLLDVVSLWSGGLTMYGGVLSAMLAAWIYLRRRQVSFLKVADTMAPSLALGLGLTRVGCFLNGCCYGKPTTGPFGVHFPPDSFVTRMFGAAAVHPSQLYSALTGLIGFGILLLYDRRRSLPVGRLFALYLMLDGIGRFLLDFSRYYEANVYIVGLTVNQLISIGLFLLGLALCFRRSVSAEALPATAGTPATPGPEVP
jgi:phosphatidylglycerol:prolipoprotein diacylglycerol transferase